MLCSSACRKRPTSSRLGLDEIPPTFEVPSPSAQRGTSLHSQRPSVGIYNNRYAGSGDPPSKRQRTSVDLSDRLLIDPDRYNTRSYMDQRTFGTHNTRDQATSTFPPAYNQGPQSALGSVSDYSYSHQRTNSSNTSSPFVSPQTEISGHSWPSTMFYQTPVKDPSFMYPQNQYANMQLYRPSQLAEPFMRQRSQNLPGQLPLNNNLSLSRSLDSENPAMGTYGQVPRPLPLSSHYTDPTPRLPPADHGNNFTSPNRPQYPDTSISNVLPPLESTVNSSQQRGSSQHILPSNVLPSIEPHTLAQSPNHPVQEHGQETYEGHESYDNAPFDFPLSNQKRAEEG